MKLEKANQSSNRANFCFLFPSRHYNAHFSALECNPMLKILIGTFFHVIRLYSTNVIPFFANFVKALSIILCLINV